MIPAAEHGTYCLSHLYLSPLPSSLLPDFFINCAASASSADIDGSTCLWEPKAAHEQTNMSNEVCQQPGYCSGSGSPGEIHAVLQSGEDEGQHGLSLRTATFGIPRRDLILIHLQVDNSTFWMPRRCCVCLAPRQMM